MTETLRKPMLIVVCVTALAFGAQVDARQRPTPPTPPPAPPAPTAQPAVPVPTAPAAAEARPRAEAPDLLPVNAVNVQLELVITESRGSEPIDALRKELDRVRQQFAKGLASEQQVDQLEQQFRQRVPQQKTVTMLVANRQSGRIRTSRVTPGGFVNGQPFDSANFVLNLDAQVSVYISGNIAVSATFEYRPPQETGDGIATPVPSLNETLQVVLKDGQRLVVSQSADPVTDRRVTVELMATVLK